MMSKIESKNQKRLCSISAIALLLLGASYSQASLAEPAFSTEEIIIQNLDLTSFANSIGPRRIAGKWSFADYGFTDVEIRPNSVTLTREDGRWGMHFRIVSSAPDALEICFNDYGLRGPKNQQRPSYDAQSALRLTETSQGRWTAQQIEGGLETCLNNPRLRDE